MIFLILTFIVAPIASEGFVFGHWQNISTLCPSSFAIILVENKRAGCFALAVFLMACGIRCSVGLPHGVTVGLRCVIVVFPYHTHVIF